MSLLGSSDMKTKVYFPPTRYLLFTIILLSSSLLPTLANNNGKSNAIAQTTKPFLTVEKPTLGFKISYPSDWNITDNDFLYLSRRQAILLLLHSQL